MIQEKVDAILNKMKKRKINTDDLLVTMIIYDEVEKEWFKEQCDNSPHYFTINPLFRLLNPNSN